MSRSDRVKIIDKIGIEKKNRSLFYISNMLLVASGAIAVSLGTVLKDMRDPVFGYNISPIEQGMLSSLSQAGSLLALLLCSVLPFFIGRKKCCVTLGFLAPIGLLIMAFTGNPLFLFIAFLFQGMGKGACTNVTILAVSEIADNKSMGQNLLQASFALGAVLGPFLMALFPADIWRIPLLLMAIFIAVSQILLAFSNLKDTKEEREKGKRFKFPSSFSYYLNTFILFFYLSVEACLMNYLVSYCYYSGIFQDSASSLLLSFNWVAILLGRVLCAFLSSRMRKSHLLAFLSSGFIIFFIILINTKEPFIIIPALFGLGISMSGIYPTTLATQEEKYLTDPFANGLMLVTSSIAPVVMPRIVGYVTELNGGDYRLGLITLIVPLLILLSLTFLKLFIDRKSRVAVQI